MKNIISKLHNTVWIGLVLGFVVPMVSGIITLFVLHKVAALRNADLLLIACVALNAWLMNYCFKQNKENIGRGILSITFLWAFAFFTYKIWQEATGKQL